MNHAYRIQNNIIPGQITKFRDDFFVAEKKHPNMPCVAQCECRMPKFTERSFGCSGFCYRWGNGDTLVFKRINEANIPEESPIIETEYGRDCRIHGNSGIKKKKNDVN